MKVIHSIIFFAALSGAATSLFVKQTVLMFTVLNWTDARTFCRNEYVDLLSVSSIDDDIFFFPVAKGPVVWIGLSRETTETNYSQWSDESALGYTNWAWNQPGGSASERCVATYQNEWHDIPCDGMFYHACYKWEPRVVVVQEMKTWFEALKHCRTFYTDLISLNTAIDQSAIDVYFKNVQTASYWTGLHFMDGAWFWVNKESLGNLVSLPSCPVQNLRCGAQRKGDHVFQNRDCEEKMNFICYDYEKATSF